MMIIPIHCNTSKQSSHNNTLSSSPPEWAMLELNGEIISPSSLALSTIASTAKPCSRLELGSVRFTSSCVPMMTIGSHELRGKLVTLQQPFVVLKKKKRKQKREAASAINNDNAVTDEVCVSLEGERIKESNARDDSFPAAASCQTEYEIWAVIRKKMMFDEYPAAIMR